MNIQTKKTAIIILNWNSYSDTIECLNSLLRMDTQDFCVFIIDNNSSDESLQYITRYIDSMKASERIFLFPQKANLGFAKGSNVGIKIAIENGFEFIWLLNNDTVVEKNTLSQMLLFFYRYSQYSIVTSCIHYYSQKHIIWNCGGKISRLGYRKYFFNGKNESVLPQKEYISISFVTNCSSFFRRSYFENCGLLTERFFFGEEDFEMCLRAKRKHIKIACILTTKIYHKVGTSVNKVSSSLHKILIYYLNRFVDMKIYFHNQVLFLLFIMLYTLYIFICLLKLKYKLKSIITFLYVLIKKSLVLKTVEQSEFLATKLMI
jgi:GT2 family glycosyltransferase